MECMIRPKSGLVRYAIVAALTERIMEQIASERANAMREKGLGKLRNVTSPDVYGTGKAIG